MTGKGIIKGILITAAVIAVILFFLFVFPWLALYGGLRNLPDPPLPEITYGEFPFRLEYEINGARKVVEDTLVCEYAGIGMNEGLGKYLDWNESYASGAEQIMLLEVSDTEYVYYDPGPGWYYMGDDLDSFGETIQYEHDFPDAWYFRKEDDGGTSNGIVFAEELWDQYQIKLISWEYTEPIENRFSYENQ